MERASTVMKITGEHPSMQTMVIRFFHGRMYPFASMGQSTIPTEIAKLTLLISQTLFRSGSPAACLIPMIAGNNKCCHCRYFALSLPAKRSNLIITISIHPDVTYIPLPVVKTKNWDSLKSILISCPTS